MVIVAGNKANIPVSICGGMAGDIKLTRLLIGMGFRELSMPAALIPEIKQEILNTNVGLLQGQIRKILRSYDTRKIQEMLFSIATQATHLQ